MNKLILIIGVILLIISFSIYGIESVEKSNISYNLKQDGNGEYLSPVLNVKNNYVITVKNPLASSGLVSYKNMSKVTNSTTLSKYSIPTTTSFGIIKEYDNLSGKYVFIEFTNGHEYTTLTSASYSYLEDLGYMGYASTTGIIIGILVVIAGIFMKPRKKNIL